MQSPFPQAAQGATGYVPAGQSLRCAARSGRPGCSGREPALRTPGSTVQPRTVAFGRRIRATFCRRRASGRRCWRYQATLRQASKTISASRCPVMCRVAGQNLQDLGTLVVQLQVVLPGEADAAVDLHAAVGNFARGVGGVGLGDAHGPGGFGRIGVDGPGGVVDRRARRSRSTAACRRTCAARPETSRSSCRTAAGSWHIRPSLRGSTACRRACRRRHTGQPRRASGRRASSACLPTASTSLGVDRTSSNVTSAILRVASRPGVAASSSRRRHFAGTLPARGPSANERRRRARPPRRHRARTTFLPESV